MSDIKPNISLHKKRLIVHISEMKLQLERLELRKIELSDEFDKIGQSEKAAQLEISRTQEQLDKME